MESEAPRSDSELILRLALDLDEAGFTVESIAEFLGERAYLAMDREQFIPALAVTELAEGQLADLIRLFLLAVPVAAERLQIALPRTGAAGLAALGLAELHDGRYRCRVDLRPYAFEDADGEVRLWAASDLAAHQRPGVLRHDHVLGIGQASLTLAQTTTRAPADRALDLGTGCGIQTFHLLRHVRHVTATDISERALAFTRFNLLLNATALAVDPTDLEHRVSLRLGSLLEPVRGQRFDLIVSNPPFVITPRYDGELSADQFTYRDGGLPGDEIVSSLVRALPDALVEGGTAQLLGNWEVRVDAPDWHSRIEKWFTLGLDSWVIQREQLSPEQYAETWLQDASEGRDPELYGAAYRDYLRDFTARDVDSIGFGMVWLRRASSPPNLRRFEELTHPIEQPIGAHLGAAVARFDWLAQGDLPAAKLDVAEDVTEERHQRPGAEHPGVILLRQGGGLRRTTLLSSELAGFVSACDGTLTVAQIIAALEALLGEDLDLLGHVRQLVLDGFLIVSSPISSEDEHGHDRASQKGRSAAGDEANPGAEETA